MCIRDRVGTFGILFGFAEVAEDGSEFWGQLANSLPAVAAYSFLVFNLLCAPCFAAMGAIKREMNNTKWFLFAIGYQCLSLIHIFVMGNMQFADALRHAAFQVGSIITTTGYATINFDAWSQTCRTILVPVSYTHLDVYKRQ